jgi:hypothetical protein
MLLQRRQWQFAIALFLLVLFQRKQRQFTIIFLFVGVVVKKAKSASHCLLFFSLIYLWVFCYKEFFFSLFFV